MLLAGITPVLFSAVLDIIPTGGGQKDPPGLHRFACGQVLKTLLPSPCIPSPQDVGQDGEHHGARECYPSRTQLRGWLGFHLEHAGGNRVRSSRSSYFCT